jgi:hypothetical protein
MPGAVPTNDIAAAKAKALKVRERVTVFNPMVKASAENESAMFRLIKS